MANISLQVNGRYKMEGPKDFLVNQSSATSCLPHDLRNDRSTPLYKTHSDLVKFTRNDPEYENVADVLKNIHTKAISAEDSEGWLLAKVP